MVNPTWYQHTVGKFATEKTKLWKKNSLFWVWRLTVVNSALRRLSEAGRSPQLEACRGYYIAS